MRNEGRERERERVGGRKERGSREGRDGEREGRCVG